MPLSSQWRRGMRSGMSLIEVIISSVILGVVAIAYAGLFKAQVGQRDGYEELGHAMEIVARQIEYLRQLDFTLASIGPPGAAPYDRVPPFSSIFNEAGTGNSRCPDGNNLVYDGAGTGTLEAGFLPGTTRRMGDFLTSPTRYVTPPSSVSAVADGQTCVLPARSTVGPANIARTAELTLPDVLVGRGYSVVVRATRVRAAIPAANSVQPDQFLVHFQINVFRNNRAVLVVPYLRGVEL